jgi:hypothetical protein
MAVKANLHAGRQRIDVAWTAHRINATARERRPPSHVCACSKRRQVEMTIVVAQANGTRNGGTIQKLVAISVPRASSWKVVRARSWDRLACRSFLSVDQSRDAGCPAARLRRWADALIS